MNMIFSRARKDQIGSPETLWSINPKLSPEEILAVLNLRKGR
jgi:hypothetical protein